MLGPVDTKIGHYINFQRAHAAAAAAAKSLESYPALCDPIDGSPPGSPIPGILQARTLEWIAISFSNKLALLKKKKNTHTHRKYRSVQCHSVNVLIQLNNAIRVRMRTPNSA